MRSRTPQLEAEDSVMGGNGIDSILLHLDVARIGKVPLRLRSGSAISRESRTLMDHKTLRFRLPEPDPSQAGLGFAGC